MRFATIAAIFGVGLSASASAWADAPLSVMPLSPSSLQTVRLRYTHVGCTNPETVRVVQSANFITVTADALLQPDCGTVNGHFEEFTIGRLPSGEYDVALDVAPVPPSAGPVSRIGPIHVTIAGLSPPNTPHPHENYSDMWWTPAQPGTAISVSQSNERLFVAWNTYDAQGRATWFVVPDGNWIRGSDNRLRFAGAAYATNGTGWAAAPNAIPLTATAVGTAEFVPLDATHAQFNYAIQSVSGSLFIERFIS